MFQGIPLPYNDINSVRARLGQISPTFTRYDSVEAANYFKESVLMAQSISQKLSNEPLKSSQLQLSDFYMTDSISRASPTMAKCVRAFDKRSKSEVK